MKTPIVSIDSQQIILSTSLSARSFGKVNHTRLLDELGYVADVPLDSTDCADVTFSDWQFDSTQTDAAGIAAFVGASLGNGKTLYAIFEHGTQDEKTTASFAVIKAMSAAIAQDKAMQAVGAEGIGVFLENQRARILFLPAEIFEQCANNTRDSYADFQGMYIRKGLEGKESLLFTRAVIAYRAASGALPYTEPDVSKRQADIFDARFVPSYFMRPDMDATLASAIDCGLQVSAEARIVPGERRFVNEKEAERREKILHAAGAFSLASFKQTLETEPVISADLLSQRETFLKKQHATILRRRFFRRNRSRIMAGTIAVLLALWAVVSFQNENKKLATSKGLDSWHTTQTMYALVHKSNVPSLREIAKGKKVKNLIQIVSGFYVTTRSRYAMNQEEGTVSPAAWLFLKNKTKFWQYGLSQLRIDGIAADTAFAYPTRADKPQPLAQETGITLKRGAQTQHKAEYYLIHNDGSARININKVTDTVTLTWKRGRWLVTDIQSKTKSSFVFTKDFYADYQAALDETGEDVARAAEMLRKTYDWIPTDDEIRAGETAVQEAFRLTN